MPAGSEQRSHAPPLVTVPYAKPALSLDQQLTKLESRGLVVADRTRAKLTLEGISYYRLSGYWHWLRDPATGAFRAGATFEEAVRLYEFDRRLRLVVLAGIERVEVLLRAALIHELSSRFGAFAHCQSITFRVGFDHARWSLGVEDETQRAREEFLEHFKAKYQGFPRVPIWMATEVASFGSLSRLFRLGLERSLVAAVSGRLGVHPSLAPSWIHSIAVVRNIAAHHGRLWNRTLGVSPTVPRDPRWVGVRPNRAYAIFRVLRQLTLPLDTGAWWMNLSALLTETDGHAAMQFSMNLPTDWATRAM